MKSLSSSSSSSVVKVKLGDYWEEEERSPPWDDGGVYTGIRSITMGFSENVRVGRVETIQVNYDLYGKSVLGQEHGADYVNVIKRSGMDDKITLSVDFPDEWVTGLYSRCHEGRGGDRFFKNNGTFNDHEFWTNRKRLGINYRWHGFNSTELKGGSAGAGAIVGFFGRSDGKSLGAIGVYMAATTATGDLLDELHHQGLMPYRISPLHLH